MFDSVLPYFEKCRRLLSGPQNALSHLRTQVGLIQQESGNLAQFKTSALEFIDEFIDNRILYAQDLVLANGKSIISEKREETLLVYGNHEPQIIEALLLQAKADGRRFTVIVADSSPDYKGRGLAKRLSGAGIKVKYTLLTMLSAII